METETEHRPRHQYFLAAVFVALALFLIPMTDVSWSAPAEGPGIASER